MRKFPLVAVLGALALASCRGAEDYSRAVDALSGPPAYVQSAWAAPQAPVSALALALGAPQAAGDALVVFVGWNDTSATISAVTDSRGDALALAVGPTKRTTVLTQSAYYARSVLAGANTVTVHFSKAAKFVDLRVVEYTGVDALDAASAASGSAALATTSLATAQAGDLIVAGVLTTTGSMSPGSGFATRLVTNPDDDQVEDRVAGAPGTYSAMAPISAPSNYVISALALRPRAGAADAGSGGSSAGGSGAGGSGDGGDQAGGRGGSSVGGSGGAIADAGPDISADTGSGGSSVGGSGMGGSGSGGALADAGTGGASGACFPLRVTGRYLTDACGKPFLLAGDSPQCLSANLSAASMDAYFAARAAQGFNAAWVNMLCTTSTGGRADASTYDGVKPFDGTVGGQYDLSKPDPAYFARMDAMLASAAAHGILVFLDPIEFSGFWPVILANGEAGCRNYGRFLGTRWAAQSNIVWMQGNDMAGFSGVGSVAAIQLGIQDSGAAQPQTAELDWPALPSTLDDVDFFAPFGASTLNLSYTYNPTYALLLHDYDRADHVANVFIEGDYEGEALNSAPRPTNGHDVRAQAWWSVLSGATGQFYGNHWEVFAMDNATWAGHLASDAGPAGIKALQALLQPRAWPSLVPDESRVVLTSGLGTCMASSAAQGGGSPREQDNTCAVASRTGDGSLVIAYLPQARIVTVDMSKLSGAATARWYDPTTGAFTSIAGSPFANSGSRAFTPPSGAHADGSTDWVLLLETS